MVCSIAFLLGSCVHLTSQCFDSAEYYLALLFLPLNGHITIGSCQASLPFSLDTVIANLDCQLGTPTEEETSAEEFPLSDCPMNVSVGLLFKLLIDVERPSPMWVVPSLDKRARAV